MDRSRSVQRQHVIRPFRDGHHTFRLRAGVRLASAFMTLASTVKASLLTAAVRREAESGPLRRFTAAQQDVCNGGDSVAKLVLYW
jgi:hypothetical protein